MKEEKEKSFLENCDEIDKVLKEGVKEESPYEVFKQIDEVCEKKEEPVVESVVGEIVERGRDYSPPANLHDQYLQMMCDKSDPQRAMSAKVFSCLQCGGEYNIVQDGYPRVPLTFRCPHCKVIIGVEVSSRIWNLFAASKARGSFGETGKMLTQVDGWKPRKIIGNSIERWEEEQELIRKRAEEERKKELEIEKKRLEIEKKEREEDPLAYAIKNIVVDFLKEGKISLDKKKLQKSGKVVSEEVKSRTGVELLEREVIGILKSFRSKVEKKLV